MTQLEIPLPEIKTDDFSQAWTRFELVAAAKEWDARKQLTVLPALLRGKLLDYYLDLGDDDKVDLKTLNAALKKKVGIDRDPLMASRLFNERSQGTHEKAVDFASELKKLFTQAFPDEDTKSIVLCQRFLTGLQPSISCQVLLHKKPDTFEQAVADAIEVEEALRLNTPKSGAMPQDTVNVVSSNPNTKSYHDPLSTKLQESMDSIAKRLEQLEMKLQESKPTTRVTGGYQQSPRRPPRRNRCYLCFEEGHYKRDCPLNFNRPAGRVESWSGNN